MAAAKIVFVGNARTGKTVCARSMLAPEAGENARDHYVPTLGTEAHPVGNNWTVWDCAGDIRFRGLDDGYTIGADVIVVFAGDEIDAAPGDRTIEQWTAAIARTPGSGERSPAVVVTPAFSSAADVRALIAATLTAR